MKNQRYINGKEVIKRPIKEGESLPQLLKRLVNLLEEIDLIPGNDDPNNPHNWYGDKTLQKKEFNKRYQKLQSQNLSKEDLLNRLVDMEMVVEFENYFNFLLIKPYIASREAIFRSHEIATQSAKKRREGKSKRFDPQRQSAIKVINAIRELKGKLHQNDYGIYIIKTSKLIPPIPKSTARDYWLSETGFISTKKIGIT